MFYFEFSFNSNFIIFFRKFVCFLFFKLLYEENKCLVNLLWLNNIFYYKCYGIIWNIKNIRNCLFVFYLMNFYLMKKILNGLICDLNISILDMKWYYILFKLNG